MKKIIISTIFIMSLSLFGCQLNTNSVTTQENATNIINLESNSTYNSLTNVSNQNETLTKLNCTEPYRLYNEVLDRQGIIVTFSDNISESYDLGYSLTEPPLDSAIRTNYTLIQINPDCIPESCSYISNFQLVHLVGNRSSFLGMANLLKKSCNINVIISFGGKWTIPKTEKETYQCKDGSVKDSIGECDIIDMNSNNNISAENIDYKFGEYNNYADYIKNDLESEIGLDLVNKAYGGREGITQLRKDGKVYFIMFHNGEWESIRYWAVEVNAETGELLRYKEVTKDTNNIDLEKLWW